MIGSLLGITLVMAPASASAAPHSTASLDHDRAAPARRRARTHFALGGVFYALGITLRGAGLASMHRDSQQQPGLGFMASGTSFNAAGLAMMGFGSHAFGRLRAMQHGSSVRTRPLLGWSAFGTGLAVLIASRLVPLACFTTTCAVVTSEGGYYAGLIGASVGLSLATFSLGVDKERAFAVQPHVERSRGNTMFGLGLSGRF
jgi:hypothetical protein